MVTAEDIEMVVMFAIGCMVLGALVAAAIGAAVSDLFNGRPGE